MLYELLAAAPIGCDVVLFDYCGWGASDGWWPSERTAVADALAVWRMLLAEGQDASQVVVWGHSLGTGIGCGFLSALIAAVDGDRQCDGESEEEASCVAGGGSGDTSIEQLPRGLILEAPFTSVPDVAVAAYASWLPASLQSQLRSFLHERLTAHRYPNSDRLPHIASRLQNVAILHGRLDDLIPLEHGSQLAASAQVPLHSFERGHDDIVLDESLAPTVASILGAWGFQPA